ncbi:MAG: prepilin-type N-terminal cleavage/methylation domain-containing protein [bacterium]|nr:prepilin-type N-terminal cleavage/methylation domain-containing protein [bacterium]
MNQFLRVKTKKKGGCRGFTLIELLVVIIIIGLLAGVLLVTVRSAILKARDGRIISALGQLRTQAEIFYDNQVPTATYVGFNAGCSCAIDSCAVILVRDAANDVVRNGGCIAWGAMGDGTGTNGYAAWSALSSDASIVHCIDFTGKAGKRALVGLTAGSSANCGL